MHLMNIKNYIRRILPASLIGAWICLLASCISNDFPTPVVKVAITAFAVEGQEGNALISAENRTVTVNLNEATDIKKVKIKTLQVSDNGKASLAENQVVDLSSPYELTLSLYQDYTWKIIANQTIARTFTVEGQIGAATFNSELHEAYAKVPQDMGLEDLKLTALKLTPEGGSMDGTTALPTLKWSTFDNYASAKVSVSYHDVKDEEWTLYVLLTDLKAAVTSVDAWNKVAWLHGAGTEGKDNGFEYKKATDAEWTKVNAAAITHEGGNFTARLTHLEAGTKYVCRAYSGEDYSSETEFTTDEISMVPNLDFEDWHKEGKVIQPWAEGGTPYWDSGNDGATTLGENYNITESTTDVWQGAAFGSKAAKLSSKYIVVKFAAGNLFVGEYKATDGTNGILGFGRPYTARPTRLKGHFKYTTAPISSADDDFAYMKGKPDTCIVWVAVGDWDEPVEIRTKKSNAKYFDKNDKHVIAYGEMTCGETVSAYKDFSIELDYRATNRKPKYLLIVCSASKYGDYFTGGKGATMWVDDFSLEYDYE